MAFIEGRKVFAPNNNEEILAHMLLNAAHCFPRLYSSLPLRF